MTLSYLLHPFTGDTQRRTVKARLTTEHSASSYGQPVIVLADGEALDLISWTGCDYRVVAATAEELRQLDQILGRIMT